MNNYTVYYLTEIQGAQHLAYMQAHTKGEALRKMLAIEPNAIVESIKRYNNMY